MWCALDPSAASRCGPSRQNGHSDVTGRVKASLMVAALKAGTLGCFFHEGSRRHT